MHVITTPVTSSRPHVPLDDSLSRSPPASPLMTSFSASSVGSCFRSRAVAMATGAVYHHQSPPPTPPSVSACVLSFPRLSLTSPHSLWLSPSLSSSLTLLLTASLQMHSLSPHTLPLPSHTPSTLTHSAHAADMPVCASMWAPPTPDRAPLCHLYCARSMPVPHARAPCLCSMPVPHAPCPPLLTASSLVQQQPNHMEGTRSQSQPGA